MWRCCSGKEISDLFSFGRVSASILRARYQVPDLNFKKAKKEEGKKRQEKLEL